MKRCPHCRSIVDDEHACKLCGTTLTYETPVAHHREKYAAGRYLLLYRLKQFLPAIVATVIALPLLILAAANPFRLLSLVLLVVTWIESALMHRLAIWMQWKYNERFALFSALGYIVFFAVFSVLAAIVSYVLN